MSKTNAKGNRRKTAYDAVNTKVLELLEAGTVPWRKPWSGGERPRSINGHRYRGANLFMLYLCSPYRSPVWLTYNEAKKRGGNVKQGEKAFPIVFYKSLQIDRENPNTGETEKANIPFLRHSMVFNLEQCENLKRIPQDAEAKEETRTFNPLAECETIVDGMPRQPAIKHLEPRAYYSPRQDIVNMPRQETFSGEAEYYSTLFHELAHATGHASRLDRDTLKSVAVGARQAFFLAM